MWLVQSIGLGASLGLLSMEVIGLLLMPVAIASWIRVMSPRRHAVAGVVALVVGYEASVGGVAIPYVAQGRAGGVVFVLLVASAGLAALTGLPSAHRQDLSERLGGRAS